MIQLIMKRTRLYFYYTGWFLSLLFGILGFTRERKRKKRKKVIREPLVERLFWLSYRERQMGGWVILWCLGAKDYSSASISIILFITIKVHCDFRIYLSKLPALRHHFNSEEQYSLGLKTAHSVDRMILSFEHYTFPIIELSKRVWGLSSQLFSCLQVYSLIFPYQFFI